jgi:nitrogen fixation protein FixH
MRLGQPRRLTGRQVLWILVAAFGFVFAVNGTMAWLAEKSFPGLVSDDAYREGLEYNRTLAARRAQLALGWRADVTVTGEGTARIVTATFRDRDGAPLTGMSVTAHLVRPVVQGLDRTSVLAEAAPGTYRADIALAALGNWRLEIDATRPAFRARPAERWHMERELWIR